MELYKQDVSRDDEVEECSSAATAVGCPSQTSLAGKAEVCRGCPGRSLCSRLGAPDEDQKFIDVRMNAVKRKILILSGKGGVGKSSVAAGLATALASISSNKVGLLDLDICGPSLPRMMGVSDGQVINSDYGWVPLRSPNGGVKVLSSGCLLEKRDSAVVWRGPRKTALIKRFLKDTFWGRLDYLIFDTPPGTSDEHLTVVKALMGTNPEGALIVTTPQDLALTTIQKEINFCKKMKLPILGLVKNMDGYVCPCCQEKWQLFTDGGLHQLADDHDLPVLGSIPLDPHLVSCCEEGTNMLEEVPQSPAVTALIQLATHLDQK